MGQLVLLLWADTHPGRSDMSACPPIRPTRQMMSTYTILNGYTIVPEALYCGTALLGVGMASIFATGFLWVERRTAVTARVGAAFMVASSSGADVFPVVVGQVSPPVRPVDVAPCPTDCRGVPHGPAVPDLRDLGVLCPHIRHHHRHGPGRGAASLVAAKGRVSAGAALVGINTVYI